MCPLEEVVLSGVSGLTDCSVFALANCCASTLKEIYASGCSMITQAAINYLKVIINDLFNCVIEPQAITRANHKGERSNQTQC